jgi:peptidase E
MSRRPRQILATSGGFQRTERDFYGWRPGPLVEHAISLTGVEQPRICYLGTAGGDLPLATAAFYAAFAGRDNVRASHLALFPMPNLPDPRAHLLEQDLVWVGGGSVANLLAIWRLHRLDVAFHEAYESGVVLAGVSAGSLCWFEGGTTDSFGPDLQPVRNGLGLVKVSNCVHYDSEPARRPAYHKLIGDQTIPAGWATDDGVGLHFVEGALEEVVTDRPDAYAWRVAREDATGEVVETRVEPRLLISDGQPEPSRLDA